MVRCMRLLWCAGEAVLLGQMRYTYTAVVLYGYGQATRQIRVRVSW